MSWVRPRAVPRVSPPSPFHVPPAWSVSSSLGSLLMLLTGRAFSMSCMPTSTPVKHARANFQVLLIQLVLLQLDVLLHVLLVQLLLLLLHVLPCTVL